MGGGHEQLLSRPVCSQLLRDPTHLFRHMWASHSWGLATNPATTQCWLTGREKPFNRQPWHTFFDQTLKCLHCGTTNWLEGTPGHVGLYDRTANHSRAAPAVVGLDDDIERVCTGSGKVAYDGRDKRQKYAPHELSFAFRCTRYLLPPTQHAVHPNRTALHRISQLTCVDAPRVQRDPARDRQVPDARRGLRSCRLQHPVSPWQTVAL